VLFRVVVGETARLSEPVFTDLVDLLLRVDELLVSLLLPE
jgi:hypothetical protein